jgi:hypothetical protein
MKQLYFIFIVSYCGLASCRDFEEINESPNNPRRRPTRNCCLLKSNGMRSVPVRGRIRFMPTKCWCGPTGKTVVGIQLQRPGRSGSYQKPVRGKTIKSTRKHGGGNEN